MPLLLGEATPADAPRIAQIHMAAFGPNAMLRAQFPTPEVRRELEASIEAKALADIEDSKTTVLVVREADTETSETSPVVAFAKWSHPVHSHEVYEEPPWVWPDGTDHAVLDAWTKKCEDAQQRVMGERACYRLTFIATDPSHRRRGAGAMLVDWGIQKSIADHVPVYIESTLEAAPLYEKCGLTSRDNVLLEYTAAGKDLPEVYKEVVYVLEP